nr:receptor-interacting serine/threonine-protein kinase 3-like isoform X2 [Scatophagus argus]
MEKASCEFVLRVYGKYQGCPLGGTHMQQGIVMEFMERGSVQALLNDLSGPPPWPLAFRWANQVALGMNFLHSKDLMHQDLKPSNVLLNDDFNAKIADFGLSRVSTSVLNCSGEGAGEEQPGGSYKYMPPEAFEASYEPVRAFDRYSYGILLWSIVTGKEPYEMADYNLVVLRIPMGDRPSCEKIDQMKVEGLKELVDLMQRCWTKNPSMRPTFQYCIEVTEKVFLKHKKGIHDAIREVLTRLESPPSNQHSKTSVASTFPLQTPGALPNPVCGSEQSESIDMDYARSVSKTASSSVQDPASVCTAKLSVTDKSRFVDDNMAELIQQVSEVMAIVEELGHMVHGETYSVIEAKETSQAKMRALYQRTFRSGGVKVKAAFYDALRRHHPELVERLGGDF